MRGGRAFTKPLPFMLGTNGGMCDYGIDTSGISFAQGIGMQVYRNDVPWNFTDGGFTGIEAVAGTYSSANASVVANVASAIKTAGMRPLFVLTVPSNPGLSATWTSGPPCTPAQFASMMAWLVAQNGLQGLDWELFNEPDGMSWGIPANLLTEAYQLAYPAMKSADPTCTVHGVVIENLATPAIDYPEGTAYYNSCVTAGILGYYDILSFHQYGNNKNGTTLDCPPDGFNVWNFTFPQMIGTFQAVRVAAGDTTPMWMTEFGWNSTGDGIMTPQLQAQFYQNLLVDLTGNDPVNGVAFSSYLKAVLNYEITGSDVHWSIIDPSTGNPKPAVQVLTDLVSGH